MVWPEGRPIATTDGEVAAVGNEIAPGILAWLNTSPRNRLVNALLGAQIVVIARERWTAVEEETQNHGK